MRSAESWKYAHEPEDETLCQLKQWTVSNINLTHAEFLDLHREYKKSDNPDLLKNKKQPSELVNVITNALTKCCEKSDIPLE